ncbi:MAG TPA: hypothetical protein VK659_11205 [Asanoa sp.]|nr:hypothetical protein [Asanoa sp.]
MPPGKSCRTRSTGSRGAIFRDGKVVNTWTLDIADGRIQTIHAVLNPDKLGHIGPVADVWAVVRETYRARSAPPLPS